MTEEKQEQVQDTKFVVITPAYNVADSIVQTILSVVAQSYDSWRMIIRDDMSTDNTIEIAAGLIARLGLADRFTLVKNNVKHGEVRNTLEAAKLVEDDEVIVRLDGGDWITENDAFAMIDHAYRATDCGALWTAHRWAFTTKNISGPLTEEDADVYKVPWVSSHMKTWRKSMMNGINDENYRDETGEYAMIACDQFVYLPILQNCLDKGKKRLFLPVCAYHYSIDLDDKELFTKERSVKQKENAEWLRKRGYVR